MSILKGYKFVAEGGFSAAYLNKHKKRILIIQDSKADYRYEEEYEADYDLSKEFIMFVRDRVPDKCKMHFPEISTVDSGNDQQFAFEMPQYYRFNSTDSDLFDILKLDEYKDCTLNLALKYLDDFVNRSENAEWDVFAKNLALSKPCQENIKKSQNKLDYLNSVILLDVVHVPAWDSKDKRDRFYNGFSDNDFKKERQGIKYNFTRKHLLELK